MRPQLRRVGLAVALALLVASGTAGAWWGVPSAPPHAPRALALTRALIASGPGPTASASSQGPPGPFHASDVVPRSSAAPANATPPGEPTITSVVPGPGLVTITWTPPAGNATVTSYLVQWGGENSPSGNETEAGLNTTALITGLVAFVHYNVNVTALNGTAAGPPSTTVHLLLYGWTLLSGSVSPASASVRVDVASVPVVGGTYSDNTSLYPHLVSVSARNYRTVDLVLLPVWNGTSWGNVTLSFLPGIVQGYVDPAASNVTWNGTAESVLYTGFFSFPVAAGATGTLAVSYPGLVPWQGNVTVSANVTVWRNVTLAAPNASLLLHIDPVDSTLVVDGDPVALDAAGNATVSLPAGTHRLEVTHAAYYPLFANVTLTSGQQDHVVLNLTALPVTTNPSGSSGPKSPFSDPVVLALLAGVAALAVLIVVLGRRGRAPEPPRIPEPDEYGVEDTRATEVVEPPGSDPPPT